MTQNGERRVFNHEKELHHLIAAIKQSQNPFLPKLQPLMRVDNLFSTNFPNIAQKLLCHCRETPKSILARIYLGGNEVLICLGPEGDFTKEEVQTAESNGFESVTLGNEVLRAETAAIAAVVAIKTINQLL